MLRVLQGSRERGWCRTPQQRWRHAASHVGEVSADRSGRAGQANPAGFLEGVATPRGKPVAFLDTFFPAQDPSRHKAVLGTAFLTLAVFVVLYVLVYVECLVGRWLWASALLTWACLVTLGYVLVFDAWTNAACAWEQVTPASLGADAAGRPCPLWASGPPFGVPDAAPAHSRGCGSATWGGPRLLLSCWFSGLSGGGVCGSGRQKGVS